MKYIITYSLDDYDASADCGEIYDTLLEAQVQKTQLESGPMKECFSNIKIWKAEEVL